MEWLGPLMSQVHRKLWLFVMRTAAKVRENRARERILAIRVFIGSSKEQRQLAEWLTAFMTSDYHGRLIPIPWYDNTYWPGGRYTLENLLSVVASSDAAVLFWTADDKTWYRGTEVDEPRDNLTFEAGLFIAALGRERTQLMVPDYKSED